MVNAGAAMTASGNNRFWPPPGNEERLALYEQNTALYKGLFVQVFTKLPFHVQVDADRDSVPMNFLSPLTNILAERLFGEGIEITVDPKIDGDEEEASDADLTAAKIAAATMQQYLNDVYEHDLVEALNMEAGTSGSYLGDSAYKVRFDADEGRVVISTFHPSQLIPDLDPLDATKMTAANIGTIITATRNGTEQKYLWIERHELRDGEGWITNRVWKLTDSEGALSYHETNDEVDLESLPETAGLPEEQATGVDELLVVHIPNRRGALRQFWGVPDWDSAMKLLQAEIFNGATSEAAILQKHEDPWMYGPPLGDENNNIDTTRKYIEYPEGEPNTAGYLTWDGKLDERDSQQVALVTALASMGGTEYTTLVKPEEHGPLSGTAIRRAQMRTQATVRRKITRWRSGLQEVFSLVAKLAFANRVDLDGIGTIVALESEGIAVAFGDGLPPDEGEEMTVVTQARSAQIMSLETSIRKTQAQLTEKQIQEEIDRIATEGTVRTQELLPIVQASTTIAAESDIAERLAARQEGGEPVG